MPAFGVRATALAAAATALCWAGFAFAGGTANNTEVVIQLALQVGGKAQLSSQGVVTASVSENTGGRLGMTASDLKGWTSLGWDAKMRENGDAIAVGEVVRFRLDAAVNERSKIRIGLCGARCSVVTTWGVSPGSPEGVPVLGNIRWQSRGSDINDNVGSQDWNIYTGPDTFAKEKYLTFGVLRRSEVQMAVWTEVDGRRSADVVLPLAPDRDKLFVASFVGSYSFLTSSDAKSNVLTCKRAPGLLVSPAIPNAPSGSTQHWGCMEVQHRAGDNATGDFGLLLTAVQASGGTRALAALMHDAQGFNNGWTQSRVLLPLPAEPWRLVVSAPLSWQVESIRECDHAVGDTVEMGQLLDEYRLPRIPEDFLFRFERRQDFGRDETGACLNGGRLRRNLCLCEPGFTGIRCDEACRVGSVGSACQIQCQRRTDCGANSSGASLCASQPCWGSLVCDGGGLCQCAPGFKGSRCEEGCDAGEYGAGCARRCGACAGRATCDPFSGLCPLGCRPGYTGLTCTDELVHMAVPPVVTASGPDFVEGTVTLADDTTAGGGYASLVDVQYRVIDTHASPWQSVGMQQLPSPWGRDPWRTEGAARHVVAWRVDGEGTVQVRCVLRDAELGGLDREGLPSTYADGNATSSSARGGDLAEEEEEGGITEVRATPVDPWTVNVTWRQAAVGDVAVAYQCERLLLCESGCGHSAGLVWVPEDADDRSVLLEGLLPGARYRVSLSSGREEDEEVVATVTTRFAAPSSVPTRGRVVRWGAHAATLRWEDGEDTARCALDNGPRAGFHWELHEQGQQRPTRVGNATRPGLALRRLRAGQRHALRVFNRGVDGWQRDPPRGPLVIDFQTLPSP